MIWKIKKPPEALQFKSKDIDKAQALLFMHKGEYQTINLSYTEILHHLAKRCPLLPTPFIEEISFMITHKKPVFVSENLWRHILFRIHYLVQEQDSISKILGLGWSLKDFFGCHPTHPFKRCDYQGYVLSSFKDRILSFDHPNVTTETHTKGRVKYTSNSCKKDVVLLRTFMEKEIDQGSYVDPNEHLKTTLKYYLQHHKESSPLKYRGLDELAATFRLEERVLFPVLNRLLEQGEIKQEYTGIFCL